MSKHSCPPEEPRRKTGDSGADYPTQDTTGRFAVDELLRSFGWKIHARPRAGEPLWRKRTVVCTQSAVLGDLPEHKVRNAQRLEANYYGRLFP